MLSLGFIKRYNKPIRGKRINKAANIRRYSNERKNVFPKDCSGYQQLPYR